MTNSPRRPGGLSKVASVQSIRKLKDQGPAGQDQTKQTQLQNLKQALELNEEALREEQYIEGKHREFLFQEKQRFDEIIININNKIAYCNEQIQCLMQNLPVNPLKISSDNLVLQSLGLRSSWQPSGFKLQNRSIREPADDEVVVEDV